MTTSLAHQPFESALADPKALRAAFGHFPSGVAAICAVMDGERVGMVASSFSVGVSFEPPLVMFSAQSASATWKRLREAPRIGISILSSAHEEAVLRLASRTGDRFEGLETLETESGSLFVPGSGLLLDCSVLSETPAGDHSIVVLEVVSLKVDTEAKPLIYHGAKLHGLAHRS
jgi:flavin reductase (DIM6/NTAB) family NADH-FMN oxidoreductase RutF